MSDDQGMLIEDAQLRAGLLHGVQQAIDANRQNAKKWQPLYDWFEHKLGVSDSDVQGKLLTETKQLSNRLTKELPRNNPEYVVLASVGDDYDIADVVRHLSDANLPRVKCAVIFEGATPVKLLVYDSDTVVETLCRLVHEVSPEKRERPGRGHKPAEVAAKPPPEKHPGMAAVPIVVDERVRRIVRLAITSTPAVVLVGPPGTGKTLLLAEVIEEIAADPAAFGFSLELESPKWTTPEESWTTADLLGGETVDEKNRLRFRPGHVLDAITQGRWLVLDEANRADMDKIFGGLLTWLAGQSVELGRVATSPDSPAVRLEWGEHPECQTERVDQLSEDSPAGDSVRYIAGTEWRLLGTYNALDAQRVFRWGQAIGRRFARVPIPSLSVERFAEALQPLLAGIPERVGSAVVGLYAVHAASEVTELGPGLFTRIPEYVRAGLGSRTSDVLNEGQPSITDDTNDNQSGETSQVTEEQSTDDRSGAEEDNLGSAKEAALATLIAEGYVINVGTWLARLEIGELEALGTRITDAGALPRHEWDWVVDMTRALG